MAFTEIVLNLDLNKRVKTNDGLGRPLSLDEGDENWDKLGIAIQDIINQINLNFEDVGNNIIPKGKGIVMTDGVINDDGRLEGTEYWYICDGDTYNGIITPDCRNRMIVGAGDEYTTDDTGGIDQAPDHSHTDPPAGDHALTVDQIPAHTHRLEKNGKPAVFWNGFVQEAGGKSNPSYAYSGSPPETSTITQPAGGGQPHSHPSGGQTSEDGGHDNKPRYYALVFVKYCRPDDE